MERNNQAHNIAKDVTVNGRCQTARWSFLTYINRKINETKQLEIYSWHYTKNKERKKRSQNYYTLRLKLGIYPVLGQMVKKYVLRFF